MALRERPRREVHVRVAEAGENAAAAEVDTVRAGKRSLVRADAARDPVAGDRERPRDRQSRVHRPDDAVLEDHPRDCKSSPGRRNLPSPPFVQAIVNSLVILLLLVVMAALATYWPTSG